MYKSPPLIDANYDAMMFARSPEATRAAACKLVRHILGEEALARPLVETLRKCANCVGLLPSLSRSPATRTNLASLAILGNR